MVYNQYIQGIGVLKKEESKMKRSSILAILLVFAMVLCFAACGKEDKAEKVTVSFDTDGGNAIEAQVINKGSAVVKPDTPKKEGYIFDKWMLGSKEYTFGTPVNENIVLKASWIDPNSGNSGSGEGSGSGSGSGSGEGGSSSEEIKVEELYWVNNWYWVQELCDGDPEFVITPASLKDKITFSSSDTSIATVDKNGIVHGIKPGNVTITMKCGDKTDTLPLEVRSAPKAGISLNKDHLTLHYTTNETSNSIFPLTVSFENGADPSSTVTWTSSNPAVADVYDGMVVECDLGHAVITATTSEGYTATCDVYIVGTALRVDYKGSHLAYGANMGLYYTYELSIYEDHYYESGLSKSVPIANQVTLMGPTGVTFAPQSEYYGILYFDSSYISSGEDITIQFSDPLNSVVSDLYLIHIQ